MPAMSAGDRADWHGHVVEERRATALERRVGQSAGCEQHLAFGLLVGGHDERGAGLLAAACHPRHGVNAPGLVRACEDQCGRVGIEVHPLERLDGVHGRAIHHLEQ